MCIYIYIYIMEYCSAIKKNEIFPFAVTGLDVKGIMLSKMSQKKTNITWSHLNVESKTQNKWTNKMQIGLYRQSKLVVFGSAGSGELGAIDEVHERYRLSVIE